VRDADPQAAPAQVATVSASPRDHELVQRLLRGDEQAFRGLVGELQPLLLRLAQTVVRSTSVAEEVVQDTWLAVLSGLATFAGRSSLKTWIVRILFNRARTRAVREQRSVPMSALGSDDELTPSADTFTADGAWRNAPGSFPEASSPELLLADAEARALVEEAIAALPEQQRLVIELHDVAELDASEVCALLDLSDANQRVLLHRARHKVRSLLMKHAVR
jgi:RNA polymerase sigma-70 factor (ECF subfamily)